MEAKSDDEPSALTEPVVVPCLFLTGVGVELNSGIVRFVGWTEMPDFGSEVTERRIAMRVSLPAEAARELAADIRKALARGGH